MLKHKYTNETAPTNTGSLTRPARFNLRCTCSDKARTLKVISAFRENKEQCGADIWHDSLLPILEAHARDLKHTGAKPSEYLAQLKAFLKKNA